MDVLRHLVAEDVHCVEDAKLDWISRRGFTTGALFGEWWIFDDFGS